MTQPPSASFTLVWDDRFGQYDFGPSHPFQMSYRQLAVDLLNSTTEAQTARGGPVDRIALTDPASMEELARFHAREYLRGLERFQHLDRSRMLDGGDTPSFPGCLEASARIAAGSLQAMRAVMAGEHRVSAQPGGGLHHAHAARASGFCILNDIGVSFANLFEGHERVRRIAYVDIDAHQGDGVMYGFYGDGRVLAIDFHQDGRTLFPGTGRADETGTGDGAGLKVNLPLPPGSGDREFRSLFLRIVPPLVRDYRPELIVLQHGVDGHEGDHLAQLRYRAPTYRLAVRQLRDLAEELCSGRFVLLGGGGYTPENVALTLAGSMLSMADATHPPSGALSTSWRERFETATGRSAPSRWPGPAPDLAAGSGSNVADALVRQLSTHLGRRFENASVA